MNKRTWQCGRRTFLKGAGVTMALPWLESLPVWGQTAAKAAPLRFATLFMGNGINYPNWWAKGEGAEMVEGSPDEVATKLVGKIKELGLL